MIIGCMNESKNTINQSEDTLFTVILIIGYRVYTFFERKIRSFDRVILSPIILYIVHSVYRVDRK